MNVNKWGPPGWKFLHTITFNYPLNPDVNDKKRYKFFFNSIETILPCKYCRDSFKIYAKYLPIDKFLNDREGVTYWLYKIHNLVNEKVFAKKDKCCDFLEVVEKYEGFRAKGCKTIKKDNKEKKEFNTCYGSLKQNREEYKKFAERAIKKYDSIAEKFIKKLYKCPENPNKKCLEYQKQFGGEGEKEVFFPFFHHI